MQVRNDHYYTVYYYSRGNDKGRLLGISIRAGINPISAQIRFIVIKLTLNSLIRKVKENTEVFQIPPIPLC